MPYPVDLFVYWIQWGSFWRSTVDAIQAVVDTDTKARRETGKRKGFSALISIDIRNAFNTTRWNSCIEAMVRKKVPDCLLRMIHDYLSDRWVIYEGDKWSLKEEMTCGAPQGSRVGLLVWNVMYDDFLPMDLPAGTSIIGFADDALVVSQIWVLIESFVTLVIKTRELDGRAERGHLKKTILHNFFSYLV